MAVSAISTQKGRRRTGRVSTQAQIPCYSFYLVDHGYPGGDEEIGRRLGKTGRLPRLLPIFLVRASSLIPPKRISNSSIPFFFRRGGQPRVGLPPGLLPTSRAISWRIGILFSAASGPSFRYTRRPSIVRPGSLPYPGVCCFSMRSYLCKYSEFLHIQDLCKFIVFQYQHFIYLSIESRWRQNPWQTVQSLPPCHPSPSNFSSTR